MIQTTSDLRKMFDDLHDYIYANEGLLKDRIFQEIVRLLDLISRERGSNADGVSPCAISDAEWADIDGPLGEAFRSRLDGKARELASRRPDLYPGDPSFHLSTRTLGHSVIKLATIDWATIPADVKGEAFQAFVYSHQRGDRGEYFTPVPLVDLMVDFLNPTSAELVLDPACGSGGFLQRVALKNPSSVENLRGVEFNPDVARAANLRVEFLGGNNDQVLVRNSLKPGSIEKDRYDIILTNPPFGAKSKVEDPGILDAYELSKNENGKSVPTAPEILFIELCINALKPGGRMGIVLPDGVLQNPTSKRIRDWLMERSTLLSVVSAPTETFIPYGTGVKTSVVFVEKGQRTTGTRPVYFALIRRIGYNSRGKPMLLPPKNPIGQLELDTSPETDTDIPRVVDDWHNGGDYQDDRFWIQRDQLEQRLDAEFYLPSYIQLERGLIDQSAVPLGELVNIVRTRSQFRQTPGPIKYVSISSLDAATSRIVAPETVHASDAPSRATYEIQDGDVLTAVAGASTGTSAHASALVTRQNSGWICSNGLAVLRPKSGVASTWILAWLRQPVVLRQIMKFRTGHAIPAIALQDLERVLIPRPLEKLAKDVSTTFRELEAVRATETKLLEEMDSTLAQASDITSIDAAPYYGDDADPAQ